MKALIYVRTSSCEHLAKKLIEGCKEFCLENQLDIKDIYFDLVSGRSNPKNRYKGFLKLLENIQPEDCIVCDRLKALPDFFTKTKPTIPIRFPGDEAFLMELYSIFINSFIKT